MKILVVVLSILFIVLQIKLWAGSGSVRDIWRLKETVATQQRENSVLNERNNALQAEVQDLKTGYAAVEERARTELGMIKPDETFYQVVQK